MGDSRMMWEETGAIYGGATTKESELVTSYDALILPSR
jgi:hypothetical protein